MFYFLVGLAIFICILLALFILIQEPKGGGLSSGFAGTNSIMGVQRTGDILEKGTWVLVVSLMVVVLMINVVIPRGGAASSDTDLQKQITKPAPAAAPIAPVMPRAADTTKK